MSKTLILQSHRKPLPYAWLNVCLDSVRRWSELNQFDYQFIGDELFESVPPELMAKTRHQLVIATDLARLYCLQTALKNNYQRVIWLDADVLIIKPTAFVLPDIPYAVGREVWVQYDKRNKLKVYKKVHNAFLLFCQGNAFLEFYIETAQRLLAQNEGTIPPQFIGPKLLTALHNVTQLPVMETAGMLSPLVIKNMIKGEGPALDLFIAHSLQPIAAANLCCSSCESDEISEEEMTQFVDKFAGN